MPTAAAGTTTEVTGTQGLIRPLVLGFEVTLISRYLSAVVPIKAIAGVVHLFRTVAATLPEKMENFDANLSKYRTHWSCHC